MPAYSRILLPWDSQPQEGTGVNPDFRLPLEFLWNGAHNTVDAVTGLLWTRGTGLTDDAHAFGRGVSGSSGATGFSRSGGKTSAETKYTFVGVFKRTGAIAYQSIFISSGTNTGVSMACDSGGTVLSWVKRGVTSFGSLTLPLNEDVCVVASHDQTSGAYYLLMRNLVTGVVTRSAGTDTNGSSAGNGTYRILRGHDNSFAGSLGLAGFAFAYLPEALAYDILSNPWQIFAPRSIWVPVSSGSAPATFQAAWARNANTVLVGGRL